MVYQEYSTSLGRIFTENMLVALLIKQFLAFYVNRNFVTALTKGRRSTLSPFSWIQYSLHLVYLRSACISSSHHWPRSVFRAIHSRFQAHRFNLVHNAYITPHFLEGQYCSQGSDSLRAVLSVLESRLG